ncbi:hypothetical protein QQS21_003243 [Conoideocrella luteorostrata]|uniref:Uncharacterized protein n=1 Tax=Conoideocrella luteorostrata TaxID=1105319 RepID=A0AAJ0CXP5_9HYPO|nr:hypothetical protein QQS21_003243 [Conoideocrella luteorostrata]
MNSKRPALEQLPPLSSKRQREPENWPGYASTPVHRILWDLCPSMGWCTPPLHSFQLMENYGGPLWYFEPGLDERPIVTFHAIRNAIHKVNAAYSLHHFTVAYRSFRVDTRHVIRSEND